MSSIILRISILMLSMSSTGCSTILDLTDPGIVDGGPPGREYRCGYAMPGFNCNNGRSHLAVVAPDMTSAISMCHAVQPMPTLDFCYVIDDGGAGSTDADQCATASGSWRPNSTCCNFEGTLSCP